MLRGSLCHIVLVATNIAIPVLLFLAFSQTKTIYVQQLRMSYQPICVKVIIETSEVLQLLMDMILYIL